MTTRIRKLPDDVRFAGIRRRGGGRYSAWLDAGYREHYHRGGTASLRRTPYLLQKRIRDDAGVTLFFANIWAYDWSEFPGWSGEQVAYAAVVQFNTHGDQSPTFDVELHRAGSPAETEAFFRRMYDAMGCQPYGDD